MKKLIALLLAAIMVLSLAACASSPAADQPANDQTTADTTTTEETKTEEKTEEKTEDTAASGDVEVVTYYCSIGAYLNTLQAEVANWNETTGKEKGVEIQIISDINDYSNNARALMQGGTFYDLVDAGTGSADWIVSGWIQDLNTIDNAELKELIAGYEPYIQNGINIQQGILVALPLEVVPIKFAVNLDLFEKNGLELPKTWEDVYNCAKVITENGNGEEFGYGWCTWTAGMIRRGTFKVAMNSTGRGWFDPNTATYDFTQFKPILEIEAKMMQEGLLLGADDLGIDEIRAQFAAGKVGMFYAPSYDYGVYTSQFPAECNWTVIDPPAIVDETPYKGVYLDRVGCSITAPAYEAASDAHKQAIIDAFIFLNSDELNSKIYSVGGMIPYKTEVIENTELSADLGPQWAQFGDISNYASMSLYPDSLLPLEGENFNTVLDSYLRGDLDDLDAVCADLAERYNAAYKELKESGDVDLSQYEYAYDISKSFISLLLNTSFTKRRPQLRPPFCVCARPKASPSRGGGSAERRDGEVVANLIQPLSLLRRQLP